MSNLKVLCHLGNLIRCFGLTSSAISQPSSESSWHPSTGVPSESP